MSYIVHIEAWYQVEENTEKQADSTLRHELDPAYESLVTPIRVTTIDIVEVVCPYCGSNVVTLKDGGMWHCWTCNQRFAGGTDDIPETDRPS